MLPPVRWLLWFVVVVLTLSFIFAPEPKPVNWDKFEAHTTSDSRLYFNNIRSFYYHRYPEERPPMILYRLKNRVNDTTHVQLHFTIVQNILTDEAFTVAEWQNLPESKENMRLMAYTQKDTVTLPLNNLNARGEYQLAQVVYTTLQEEGQLYLAHKNDSIAGLLHTPKQRETVETVLRDYFKLIQKLKS